MTENDNTNETSEEDIPIVHTEPNPFWKQNAEKLVGESISSMEDTAKQFIAITGLLQGIFFHAIAFSDIKYSSSSSGVIYYASPLLLWFLSLLFAVFVLFRKRYGININSSQDSKEKFEEIVVGKYKLLRISGVFLVLSFAALVLAFLQYLGII